jgi:hypothetical protein
MPTYKFRYHVMNHSVLTAGSTEQWDVELTDEIALGFLTELSPAERKLIEHNGWIGADARRIDVIIERIIKHGPDCPALLAKLDAFILYVARTAGSRIILCRFVQRRFYDWSSEEGGPEKLRRFGMATAHAARMLQRKGPVPLKDPDWHRYRKESIQKLKLLFQQLADIIRRRARPPSLAKMVTVAREILDGQPKGFGLLRRNWNSFSEFVTSHEALADMLRAGEKVSAPTLFNEWVGWRTAHTPEKVGERISRIGSTKRTHPV